MNELIKSAKAVISRWDRSPLSVDRLTMGDLRAAVGRAESIHPVRLSDEEICEIAKTSRAIEGKAMLPVTFARAIEKAVWEKNQCKS